MEGTYMRRTFTGRIVFDTSELRKLLSHSQSKAAVDVRGICPSSQCTFTKRYAGLAYISAWASALLVLL